MQQKVEVESQLLQLASLNSSYHLLDSNPIIKTFKSLILVVITSP